MRIAVVGCGYLGAVHAASMAQRGHDVIGIDVDLAKVEALSHGKASFYEPGFDDLLTTTLATGRLAFTSDAPGRGRARVHFVCVGKANPPVDVDRRFAPGERGREPG